MPLSLRVGVLIIGSLDWESKRYEGIGDCEPDLEFRLPWRESRLRADEESTWRVNVPIRYGRKSGQNRGHTFTMVVSPERLTNQGIGKAVRCAKDAASIDDLIEEAVALWRAERKAVDGDAICACWGCITILTPPDFLTGDNPAERQALLDAWEARTGQDETYGKLGFSPEDCLAAGTETIIRDGRLQIPWPKQVSGEELPLDLMLITATNAEIGSKRHAYPSPSEMAAAWKAAPQHANYFQGNRFVGLETADDAEIARLLV